ncbi:MAG: hypothetical protein ACXWD4_15130 [Bacteroidia bacterium]
MGCYLKHLGVLFLICAGFTFTSCEDDAIIAPKGQTAAGSYGRMSFPDSSKAPVIIISSDNPEVF